MGHTALLVVSLPFFFSQKVYHNCLSRFYYNVPFKHKVIVVATRRWTKLRPTTVVKEVKEEGRKRDSCNSNNNIKNNSSYREWHGMVHGRGNRNKSCGDSVMKQ